MCGSDLAILDFVSLTHPEHVFRIAETPDRGNDPGFIWCYLLGGGLRLVLPGAEHLLSDLEIHGGGARLPTVLHVQTEADAVLRRLVPVVRLDGPAETVHDVLNGALVNRLPLVVLGDLTGDGDRLSRTGLSGDLNPRLRRAVVLRLSAVRSGLRDRTVGELQVTEIHFLLLS